MDNHKQSLKDEIEAMGKKTKYPLGSSGLQEHDLTTLLRENGMCGVEEECPTSQELQRFVPQTKPSGCL